MRRGERRGRSRTEPIISRPLLLAKVSMAASDADQTRLYLNPRHGRAAMPRKLLYSIDATASQSRDLDSWDCLLRVISESIAPVFGPPPGLPATRSVPDFGVDRSDCCLLDVPTSA